MDFLYVGIGGAIGSILRYCLSLLPIHTHFPFLTFITNIIGAILIGFITSLFDNQIISPQVNKLLKTGLCGGFTTFSTFSLETITLLENGQIVKIDNTKILKATGLKKEDFTSIEDGIKIELKNVGF